MGTGCFTWLNLLETFVSTDRGRKIFGFDDLAGYNRHITKTDTDIAGLLHKRYQRRFSIKKETLDKLINLHNSDNLIPNDHRCVLIEGDVMETFNKFREKNPGVRACLANIDLNLYEPTKSF